MDCKAIITAGADCGKKLLGLTLLERSVLSLHRAGVSDIRIAVADPAVKAEQILSRSRALKRKSIDVSLITKKPARLPAGNYILLSDNIVFDWKGAMELASAAKKASAFTDLAGSKVVEIVPQTAALKSIKELFEGKTEKPGRTKGKVFPGWGCVRVSDRASYRQARRELLVSMRKPTDGFVSRNFNRYVSLFLSRFFLVLRLTPNSISFGNLALGVFGAVLIATTASAGEYWKILTAGLIFQLTSIIDGCDGEVAKLSFSDSDKGAWIDTVCDQLGYFTFFIGLPIGLYNATGNPLYLILGGMTFVFIGLLFFMMTRYVKRRGEGGSMLLIITDIQKAAAGKGWFALMNRIVFGMSFIFRRDFFAFFAMSFCIINQVWILQWFISVFVTLQSLYIVFFSWYTDRKQG